MKKKSPVDELQSLFSTYEESMKLLNEHVERIEKKIDEVQKNITGERPTILTELINKLQLDPKPIDGKYRPASGDYKQFVYWIVDNEYDKFLTKDNFFTFIHCTIKEENIKRYFRDAKEERDH